MSSFVAFAVSAVCCRLLLGWAECLRLVDHPIGRKDHEHPTPVIGGIAIYAALLPAFALACLAEPGSGDAGDADCRCHVDRCWRGGRCFRLAVAGPYSGAVWLGSGAVCLRLCAAQSVAVLGRLAAEPGIFAIPFTVFAVVGLINAVNMIDGVDGLAGSIVASTLALMSARLWNRQTGPVRAASGRRIGRPGIPGIQFADAGSSESPGPFWATAAVPCSA